MKQMFRYMTGRQDGPSDAPMIGRTLDEFRSSGFHYRTLVVSLVRQWDFESREEAANVATNH